MEYCIKCDDKIVYLNNYYYVLNKVYDGILSSLKYEQIYFDDFSFFKQSIKKEGVLYLLKGRNYLNFYYFAKGEIQLRTKIFDMLESIKLTMKVLCNLYLFESEDIEGNYHLGAIINSGYVDFIKVSIDYADNYFYLEICDELILSMLECLNQKSLISDKLSPCLIGIVLLDNNRPDVNKYLKEIIGLLNNYTLIEPDVSLSKKGQYDNLEDLGVLFIVDVNYRDYRKNMVKIKNVHSDTIVEIEKELLNEKINEFINENNQLMFKDSMKSYIDYQKSNNVVYVCEEYRIERQYITRDMVKPLAKNIIRSKCAFCDKKAIDKFFKVK